MIVVRDEREADYSLKESPSVSLTAVRVTLVQYCIDCRASAHRGILFTLALTKHGLLKKMKGAQKDNVSRRRGDGGDRSCNETSRQTDYSQFTNGCKNKTSSVPRQGDYCWCGEGSRWVLLKVNYLMISHNSQDQSEQTLAVIHRITSHCHVSFRCWWAISGNFGQRRT